MTCRECFEGLVVTTNSIRPVECERQGLNFTPEDFLIRLTRCSGLVTQTA
jgi:hypothetical protein